MTVLNATIIPRKGTAAQWTAANPVLLSGEMGVELDTRKTKFGDGATAWATLPYAAGGSGSTALVTQDEGVTLGSATTLNFAGAGVTATFNNGVTTAVIPGGGSGGSGGTLVVQDEGTTIGTAAVLNFAGAGVTTTFANGVAIATIPGGGTGSGSSPLTALYSNNFDAETTGAAIANWADDYGNLRVVATGAVSGKGYADLVQGNGAQGRLTSISRSNGTFSFSYKLPATIGTGFSGIGATWRSTGVNNFLRLDLSAAAAQTISQATRLVFQNAVAGTYTSLGTSADLPGLVGGDVVNFEITSNGHYHTFTTWRAPASKPAVPTYTFTDTLATVNTGNYGFASNFSGGTAASVIDDFIIYAPPASTTGLPAGGTTSQVLTKLSATDGDAGWGAVSGGTVNNYASTTTMVVSGVTSTYRYRGPWQANTSYLVNDVYYPVNSYSQWRRVTTAYTSGASYDESGFAGVDGSKTAGLLYGPEATINGLYDGRQFPFNSPEKGETGQEGGYQFVDDCAMNLKLLEYPGVDLPHSWPTDQNRPYGPSRTFRVKGRLLVPDMGTLRGSTSSIRHAISGSSIEPYGVFCQFTGPQFNFPYLSGMHEGVISGITFDADDSNNTLTGLSNIIEQPGNTFIEGGNSNGRIENCRVASFHTGVRCVGGQYSYLHNIKVATCQIGFLHCPNSPGYAGGTVDVSRWGQFEVAGGYKIAHLFYGGEFFSYSLNGLWAKDGNTYGPNAGLVFADSPEDAGNTDISGQNYQDMNVLYDVVIKQFKVEYSNSGQWGASNNVTVSFKRWRGDALQTINVPATDCYVQSHQHVVLDNCAFQSRLQQQVIVLDGGEVTLQNACETPEISVGWVVRARVRGSACHIADPGAMKGGIYENVKTWPSVWRQRTYNYQGGRTKAAVSFMGFGEQYTANSSDITPLKNLNSSSFTNPAQGMPWAGVAGYVSGSGGISLVSGTFADPAPNSGGGLCTKFTIGSSAVFGDRIYSPWLRGGGSQGSVSGGRFQITMLGFYNAGPNPIQMCMQYFNDTVFQGGMLMNLVQRTTNPGWGQWDEVVGSTGGHASEANGGYVFIPQFCTLWPGVWMTYASVQGMDQDYRLSMALAAPIATSTDVYTKKLSHYRMREGNETDVGRILRDRLFHG